MNRRALPFKLHPHLLKETVSTILFGYYFIQARYEQNPIQVPQCVMNKI
jgi:hypothetical protein